MTIPPITYSGPRESRHHSRRPSNNRRFSSGAQSTPALGSPRTLCPKDGDAFSYDPAHLKTWYMPQELWEQLPSQLQGSLARLQHAGAAVITGFTRLKEVGAETGVLAEEDEYCDIDIVDGTVDQDINSSRHDSFHSSVPLPMANSEPTTPPKTPISRSGANTPPMPSPISPFTLKPLKHALPLLGIPPIPSAESSKSTSPISTPIFLPAKNPHTSRYLAELVHVRSDALVRLRHAARRVDSDLGEVLRRGEFQNIICSEGDCEPAEKAEDADKQFETWWTHKKELIQSLEARGARLIKEWA